MFLIDKNHYFKRFKKPLENTFPINNNLATEREKYIQGLNLSFYHVNKNSHLTIEDSFAYVLLENSDLVIDGDFITLIIEDISTQNNKINIVNKNNSKIIFINNTQTQYSIEKEILIDNFSHLNLYLTVSKSKTFIKNNLLVNLFENSELEADVFINTDKQQTFDLTTEIIHRVSNTDSNINFIGLNEGKLVSQINSIIEKGSLDCELHQHIKHILFNENAMSYSKPSLMIESPCVASHGNSIGSIPEDWLFYLQTKGISPENCLEIIKKSLHKSFLDKINLSFIEPLLDYKNEY